MNRRTYAYVWLLFLAAVLVAATAEWSQLRVLSNEDLLGLAVFTILAILAAITGFDFSVGRHSVGSRISFVPIFAAALLFPPAAVMALAAVSEAAGEAKKGPFKAWRAAVNISQASLAYYAAALVYTSFSGHLNVAGVESFKFSFPAFLLLVVTFFGLNYLFVSTFFALREGESLFRIMAKAVGPKGGNLWYDILASPIAVITALLYSAPGLGVWGLLVVLLPLLLVRYSYKSKIELQAANRDLLTVLIKAIETRDPYTSGHSVRVSQMARAIAEDMGLPSRLIEKVETAALLHDIGKIESLYAEIISKDTSLTERERAVIKTHATKGAELLENLTSFDAVIVQGVRHHHERYDGTGYPHGLTGKAIPVAARIIMMCDSIDAMLSDRPYRNALPLAHVRTEMLRCSGTQFDPELVDVVLKGRALVREVARHEPTFEFRSGHERQIAPAEAPAGQQATA
jgi:putative nucleotidyltransferase with HDIG domain